ncbi:papilin [Culex quinquefasciatus]|uniref:Papilin n=1 Tax=Culex quinquefasciatus TaxID=7176 RepID=B0X8E4_CULQU|nr:papilin [Culex quinquefasciatus]|eukprot:XP_001865916.1 papilin [Culex quinquefasciatus]
MCLLALLQILYIDIMKCIPPYDHQRNPLTSHCPRNDCTSSLKVKHILTNVPNCFKRDSVSNNATQQTGNAESPDPAHQFNNGISERATCHLLQNFELGELGGNLDRACVSSKGDPFPFKGIPMSKKLLLLSVSSFQRKASQCRWESPPGVWKESQELPDLPQSSGQVQCHVGPAPPLPSVCCYFEFPLPLGLRKGHTDPLQPVCGICDAPAEIPARTCPRSCAHRIRNLRRGHERGENTTIVPNSMCTTKPQLDPHFCFRVEQVLEVIIPLRTNLQAIDPVRPQGASRRVQANHGPGTQGRTAGVNKPPDKKPCNGKACAPEYQKPPFPGNQLNLHLARPREKQTLVQIRRYSDHTNTLWDANQNQMPRRPIQPNQNSVGQIYGSQLHREFGKHLHRTDYWRRFWGLVPGGRYSSGGHSAQVDSRGEGRRSTSRTSGGTRIRSRDVPACCATLEINQIDDPSTLHRSQHLYPGGPAADVPNTTCTIITKNIVAAVPATNTLASRAATSAFRPATFFSYC